MHTATRPVLLAPPTNPSVPTLERELFSSYVAGAQYHVDAALIATIPPGARLVPVREPSNDWDPDAVRLYFGRTFVGYVPAERARHVRRLLDAGTPVWPTVVLVDESRLFVKLSVRVPDPDPAT